MLGAQVTRRKAETASGRTLDNGYAHHPQKRDTDNVYISIISTDAQSPFRPYGGSLFFKRQKK